MKKKNHWDIFEEDVAVYFDGKVVRGSGRAPQHKGDVICDKFLIECKSTLKDRYSVTDGLLHKIALESIGKTRDWLFCVRTALGDWCIMPMVALGDFNSFDYEQKTVRNTINVGGAFKEGIILFNSGRRVMMLEMKNARKVLGYGN